MSGPLVRIAIVLVTLLLATMFPSLTSAETRGVTFSVSSGVSYSDEMYVREGIALGINYLHDTYGMTLQDNLVVNVRDTASPIGPGVLAFANGDFLVVFTGAPAWDYLSPALRLQTIIHEFVHIFQFDMIGGGEDASPMWFIEGMADYVSFDVVRRIGVLSPDDIYDEQTWATSLGLDYMPALDQLEGMFAFQSAPGPVYSLGYLAVSELVHDDPVESLSTYLGLIAGGATWQVAFARAFGVEPREFYQQFQRWLTEEMVAPRHEPESFRLISPDGIDADVAIVHAAASVDPGQQIVVISHTEPNAGCRFELRGDDGERVNRIQTIADATGLAFWLATIPADFSSDNATIIAGCGGNRDRINVAVAA